MTLPMMAAALRKQHAEEMAELSKLMSDRADQVTINWQGGKANGIAIALAILGDVERASAALTKQP